MTATSRFWTMVTLAAALGGREAAAQTPIPPSAPDFATMAAQSDQYEIQAGRVAVTQSQNPAIRSFAQEMIEDHTRTGDSLRQAALASRMTPPPPAMGSDQAQMLAALQSLRGAEFDKAYARQQVLAHTRALAVEQSYAAAGTDSNLRRVAQSGVPLIQRHLEMAQQIRSSLGGS